MDLYSRKIGQVVIIALPASLTVKTELVHSLCNNCNHLQGCTLSQPKSRQYEAVLHLMVNNEMNSKATSHNLPLE